MNDDDVAPQYAWNNLADADDLERARKLLNEWVMYVRSLQKVEVIRGTEPQFRSLDSRTVGFLDATCC